MTDVTQATARIRDAMDRITADKSKISMGRGKLYSTVASRIEAARFIFGEDISIQTEILVHPEYKPGRVENDSMIVVRATIMDINQRVLSVGHAEEMRGSNRMTETSALEVCETSAIGRALASLGLHGGEYASANEIDIANAKAAEGRTAKPSRGRQAGPEAGPRPDIQQDPFGNHGNNPAPTAAITGDYNPEPTPADGGASEVVARHPVDGAGVPAEAGDKGVVPVALDGSKGIALEAFRTFAGSVGSVEELKQFWGKNKKVLMDLKEESPEDFALIRGVFAKRELELKGAVNK